MSEPQTPSLLRAGLDLLYPPTCLVCDAPAERVGGLCADCWRGVAFLDGRVCDRCGVPLAQETGPDTICDGCARRPPAWDRGRAAARYGGAARTLCLVLKHADRTEAAAPMARWMARAGRPLLADADLLIPIPLHWTRRLTRRFNQSAELARALSAETGLPAAARLDRVRRTPAQDGKSREERRENVAGAFRLKGDPAALAGKTLVLIDDVMTTGATLSAAAEALRPARPQAIHALVFARVYRDGTEGDLWAPAAAERNNARECDCD